MMLRRGTGGYYVNGILARWPRGGVSLRDQESYVRGGSVAVPDLATSDLQVRNDFFAENNGILFQAGGGSTIQNSLDATGNSLTASAATAASLFTTLPAAGTPPTGIAAFDWTPSATSPVATGGMATFTGKIAAKAGTVVTGTSYIGAAAPGGAKWWAGWTAYARN